LQIAACHVALNDVSTVIELIKEVEGRKNKYRSASVETLESEPAPSDGLDAEWNRLKAVNLDISKEPIQLTAHLRALENFASNLDEQGIASEAQSQEVAGQILRWTEIAQAVKNANYVDQCLAKLSDQELGPMTTDRAVSIVQAAEGVLPGFWGINSRSLPKELQRKIDNYPSVIKDRVDKISSKKSVEFVKKIDETLRLVDSLGPLPTQKKRFEMQERSEAIEEQIKEAQVLAAQLPSPNEILNAQKKIEDRTKVLRNCRSEQYSRYQSEVVRRCQEAFKVYNSYTLGISESNAVITIHNEHLSEVDQALLTPETSRMFNDVLGKLMGKLGPENLVKIEDEMSSIQKLKLETF